MGLGLSGIIPTLHYVISEGFLKAATIGQIGWLMLMASLYITGAALYAARIPERFFPGKCDIWVSVVHGDRYMFLFLLVCQWHTGSDVIKFASSETCVPVLALSLVVRFLWTGSTQCLACTVLSAAHAAVLYMQQYCTCIKCQSPRQKWCSPFHFTDGGAKVQEGSAAGLKQVAIQWKT